MAYHNLGCFWIRGKPEELRIRKMSREAAAVHSEGRKPLVGGSAEP
jgi:hypothetical protein